MKKVLLVALMAFCSLSMFAQKGVKEIGGRLNLGFDDPQVGFGFVGRYNIDQHFRPEITLDFYPENNHGLSSWDVNFNLHYLFPIAPRFKLYPMAGLGIISYRQEVDRYSATDTQLGLNLGGGMQYNITSSLHFNAELYYQCVDDYGRPVLNLGLVYVFR